MKRNFKLLIIIASALIILISFYFRVRWLNISPHSIGFDEAALGYNAFSLLKTGKDEHGRAYPLSLASFNDYKPALYAYLSMPFIKLMGLNQASIRMVSAIAGTITILLTGLIGYHFFSKKLIWASFSLLISAIQPWNLHYSRTAFESNLATALFTAGVLLILINRGLKNELVAVALFALSMYTYHSPRVAAPLFLSFYFLIKLRNEKKLKFSWRPLVKILLPLIILFVLTLPIWFSLKQGFILTRLRQESALKRLYPYSPPELTHPENIWRSFPTHPLYYLAAQITGHFFAYFSPINLGSRVFHWVRNSPQNISTFSLIGWGESLFFLIGLLFLIKNLPEKKNQIILAWVISGIVPAIATWTWFHPLRSLTIYPAMTIIIALGIIQLLKIRLPLFKTLVLMSLALLFFMQASYVINNEVVYNIYESHGEYQPGGFKQGVPELAKIQDNYDRVIIETPHAQGYIFFLFYQSFPPEKLHQFTDQRKPPGTEGDLSFDFYKYQFRKIYWPEDKELNRTIFWGSSFSLPKEEVLKEKNVKIVKEFKNVVGNPAAVMVVKD